MVDRPDCKDSRFCAKFAFTERLRKACARRLEVLKASRHSSPPQRTSSKESDLKNREAFALGFDETPVQEETFYEDILKGTSEDWMLEEYSELSDESDPESYRSEDDYDLAASYEDFSIIDSDRES